MSVFRMLPGCLLTNRLEPTRGVSEVSAVVKCPGETAVAPSQLLCAMDFPRRPWSCCTQGCVVQRRRW
jgi:hypothetical protein